MTFFTFKTAAVQEIFLVFANNYPNNFHYVKNKNKQNFIKQTNKTT